MGPGVETHPELVIEALDGGLRCGLLRFVERVDARSILCAHVTALCVGPHDGEPRMNCAVAHASLLGTSTALLRSPWPSLKYALLVKVPAQRITVGAPL